MRANARGIAVALAILACSPTVAAEPEATDETADAGPWVPLLPPRLRHGYTLPILESAGVLVGFNLGARLVGKDYTKISFDSIKTNLTSGWDWDDDAFTTNQFGHPFLGSLFYATARSNGLGFLGAAAFAYVDSIVWEVFMEVEVPSINDQIFTPFGGVLLGEALHRTARSILWREGGARPGPFRYVLATFVDPIGMVNRLAFGDAWQLVPRPPDFGWIALGWSGLEKSLGGAPDSYMNLFHAGLVYSYGLPTNDRVRPRKPFDHFDLRVEGSFSGDKSYGTLRVRGLLYGRAFGGPRLRGLWGAFGTYDFDSPERIRVSALGAGIGTVMHAPFGERTFMQGTALASVIPYGAAGAGLMNTATEHDYHRGPGVSEMVELRLGRRGLGMIRAAASTYQIFGIPFEGGYELVTLARLGGILRVYGHHGLGVEGCLSFRRATLDEAGSLSDRTSQLRVFYALLSDFDFGGGN